MLAELKKFIASSATGRRRRPDGHRFAPGTVDTYRDMQRQLTLFAETGKMKLELFTGTKCNAVIFQQEKTYWAKLYRLFTDYLYSKGCFDNYVATQLKILRTFLRYLQRERGWMLSSLLPQFRVSKETIPVIVLSPAQLHFLIHDAAFEAGLSLAQKKIKDILVAGCTVALRIGDLMGLGRQNLIKEGDRYYLSVVSEKTQTTTRLLLPGYAASIFLKYSKQTKHLLPRKPSSKYVFAYRLKAMNFGIRSHDGTINSWSGNVFKNSGLAAKRVVSKSVL